MTLKQNYSAWLDNATPKIHKLLHEKKSQRQAQDTNLQVIGWGEEPKQHRLLLLGAVLVRVSIAVTKTMTKEFWGGKALFQLTFPGESPSQREVKAGTQTGQMPEGRS